MFFVFKLFENKKNAFSYENNTKTNFENKENEFIIFNILYINKKTVMCCFPCFIIKSKTQNLMDWNKMKTPDSYFLLFIHLSSSTSIFFSLGSRKHEIINSNMHFKHIFIVFIQKNGFTKRIFLFFIFNQIQV